MEGNQDTIQLQKKKESPVFSAPGKWRLEVSMYVPRTFFKLLFYFLLKTLKVELKVTLLLFLPSRPTPL